MTARQSTAGRRNNGIHWYVLLSVAGWFLITSATNNAAQAQLINQGFADPCVQFQLVPRTIYETQRVTAWRDVMETQYQTERTRTWRPVWTTERRERRYSVLKPVTETSYRDESYYVLKPVTETGYREETWVETTWQTRTEMREEEVVEEKPVVETSWREEQVVVRKPVTETMMKNENVTVYRPVTVNETQYVPGTTAVNSWGVATTPPSTRLGWMPPSWYVDPTTGQAAFRRRGLHWVQSPPTAWYVPQTTFVPTLTPQTVQRTSMVPETVVRREPVQVTRYVDEVTTRKVPVQTQRTERRVTTRKVPVDVQVPVKRYFTKRIPVDRVTWQRQQVVRKVPVTRQRFETELRVEPYDVQVCRWEAVNKDVQVPRVVTRRIPYETTRLVPRTVMMRVPVDMFGNPLQVPGWSPYVGNQQPVLPYVEQPRIVTESPVRDYPIRSERVDTSRPAVDVRQVPGSSRIVFPESEMQSETSLSNVTPREDSDDGADSESGAQENEEHVGTIERADGAANRAPSLNDFDGDAEDGNSTSLDAPAQPETPASEEDKPEDPVDT